MGFIVEANNRPGEMARLTEELADRGVNILIYSLGLGGHAAISWVASNETATRSVLGELGMAYREIPLIHVVMTDKPGIVRTRMVFDDGNVTRSLRRPVSNSGDC